MTDGIVASLLLFAMVLALILAGVVGELVGRWHGQLREKRRVAGPCSGNETRSRTLGVARATDRE